MNIQGIIPAITAPIQGLSASAVKPMGTASTSSSSTSSTSGTSSSDLQTTFLNLLVTELQNQDPTSPVDPTEMVSQMVSLNQLDQLISINQTLANMTSGTSATSGSKASTQKSANAVLNAIGQTNATNAAASNIVPSSATPLLQVPAELTGTGIPKGLMNLYGSYRIPTATSNTALTGGR